MRIEVVAGDRGPRSSPMDTAGLLEALDVGSLEIVMQAAHPSFGTQ